jgi:succinate dehydrogenase / fumarate reductase iron-sulfur subunit
VQELENALNVFFARIPATCYCEHQKYDQFIGPRYCACSRPGNASWMVEDRLENLKNTDGIGFGNITKCCTSVCPEEIQITDNALFQ